MPSKNNPDTSGFFHVNFILSLIALLITQSAHRGYSSVNDINDIYSSIMSCCWFEARFFVTSWENVLFTLENIGLSREAGFRSPVLRGIWINASAHKTWRHLYFFLICFPYQVIYQTTCQILGFLNIHELGISWNTNLNKMGRIHAIWDNFWPQNVLF